MVDTILDAFSQSSAQSFFGKTINRIVNIKQSIEYNFLFSRIPGINAEAMGINAVYGKFYLQIRSFSLFNM